MPSTTPKHNIPYPLAAERVADFPAIARQLAEKLESILPSDGKQLIAGKLYDLTGTTSDFPQPAFGSPFGQTWTATITVNNPFTPPAGYGFVFAVEVSSGFTTVEVAQRTSTNTQLRVIQVGSAQRNALQKLRYWLVKL